jgi:hypothetical protein
MPIYSRPNDWGGNSISRALFDYLKDNLLEGKTILELGSGWGTGQLMKHWNVWSVESKPEWFAKYNKVQSLYVPIKEKGGWYDVQTLKSVLEGKDYDLLLVDGPYNNREGLINNFHLFNQNVPVVFDDVNKEAGKRIIREISNILKRPYSLQGYGRSTFGVIV